MYINFNDAKTNMIEGLYETTVNNIATLSNKLAESGEDEVYIETVIDSEFDSRYYRIIEYRLNNSDFSYKKTDKDSIVGVPKWFVENIDIPLKSVTVDVASGWEIYGALSVQGDSNIIYKSLYKMFTNLLSLFLFFVTIAVLILSVLLHFVLKPLKKIQIQAEAILKNEFIIQEKEPYTTEFKEVVKGMNAMVKKVEDIFESASESAKRNSDLLYRDPLTKLFNRRYLMLKLPELIQEENELNGGSAMLISLKSIETLIEKIGEQRTQNLIIAFAKILQKSVDSNENGIVARLNEREFMLLFSALEIEKSLEMLQEINREYETLLKNEDLQRETAVINFALCSYTTATKREELLTKIDSALLSAVADEEKNFYIYEESKESSLLGKMQWKELLSSAIEKENFHLKFDEVYNTKSQEITHKVLEFTILQEDKKEYSFSDFIAPALNFKLIDKIYLTVLKKLFVQEHRVLEGSSCSVRLSHELVKDKEALVHLKKLFENHAKNIKFQLTFELPNSFVIKNKELVRDFVKLLKKYNFGFGINTFSTESHDFAYLKEFHPLFIKIDADLLLDQSDESMSALQVIANSLGIIIVANSVSKREDITLFNKKNITHIQGSAIKYLSDLSQ
jgi:diguanylate cyclase (GGDEF)-like protein